MERKLYYATNRVSKGADPKNPDSYGIDIDQAIGDNLIFGEVDLALSQKKVDKCVKDKFSGREGNGQALWRYITRQADEANITAYPDPTEGAKEAIPGDMLASNKWFKSLKVHMDQGSDVVAFIHGFNMSWERSVGAAMALEIMLNRHKKEGEPKTIVVLFTWPSDGRLFLNDAYRSDEEDALLSAPAVGKALGKLYHFLAEIKSTATTDLQPCGSALHLMCHSMGNKVLVESLKFANKRTPGGDLPRMFDHIFLCAPDLDENDLEQGEPGYKMHQLGHHISIYYNRGDAAMFLGEHVKGVSDRLGQTGSGNPDLTHEKVHQVDCSYIVKGLIEHEYYLWATVVEDIAQSIGDLPFDDDVRERRQVGVRRWRLV